jgi:hypothetical protein
MPDTTVTRAEARKPYVERPDRGEVVNSAVRGIEVILQHQDELLDRHVNLLLSDLIWKISEADGGKYGCRYRSAEVLHSKTEQAIRHEHVVRRKTLRIRLRADPSRAREIIRDAIACVVTKAEDDRLRAVDPSREGWARYHDAGITVIDMATDQSLNLARLAASTAP